MLNFWDFPFLVLEFGPKEGKETSPSFLVSSGAERPVWSDQGTTVPPEGEERRDVLCRDTLPK